MDEEPNETLRLNGKARDKGGDKNRKGFAAAIFSKAVGAKKTPTSNDGARSIFIISPKETVTYEC